MKLSEMVSKLRTKIEALASKEGLKGDDLSQLNADLAEIVRKADRTQSDITAANDESATRRVKIKDLETEITTHKTKITELEGRPDPVELQNTITAQNTKISGLMKGQRATFESRFALVSKHPNFETSKGFYKLPDPDDKGVYDLSKMTDEDLEHNLNKLAEYDQVKTYGEVKPTNVHGAPRKDLPAGDTKPAETKSETEVKSTLKDAFAKY